MVNTRKKSYVPPVNESGEPDSQAPGYQSDSSTSSTTRRLTRRSVGVVATEAPQTVSTPIRRSRRLSNSSVESVHADTPKPAATVRRRTSRTNRGAASDSETEGDVELSKRRKIIENADSLGAITEEKTETENTTAVAKPETSKDEDEDLEIVFETSIPARKIEEPAKPVTPSPEDKEIQKIEKLAAEKEEDDCCVIEEIDLEDGEEVFATPEAEENITVEAVQSVVEITTAVIAKNKSSPVSAQSQDKIETVKKPSQSDVEMTVAEDSSTLSHVGDNAPEVQAISMATIENSAITTVVEPAINQVNDNTTTKVVKKVTKKALTINERLAKLAENKTPVIITPTEVKVKPAKPLPCGADVMRNIPRGKPKSGREWKELKTNPRYLYKDKGLKMPFEKITQLRMERKRIKEFENRLKEEERARRAEITRRREINKKREEENARRGEVVQVIRNSNKIKRMNKKQLKLIQKRDTTTV